jgi:hypothetical protein
LQVGQVSIVVVVVLSVVVVISMVVVVVVGHGQSSIPPQPSEIMPQSWAPHVSGVQQLPWTQTCTSAQAGAHWPLVPMSSTRQCRHWLESQVPQFTVPPQPSGWLPQFAPPEHEVAGVQQLPLTQGCPGAQHVVPQTLSPCAQQVPSNGGFATLGLMQLREQQLWGVGHFWPLGLHGEAIAVRAPGSASVAIRSRATRSPRRSFIPRSS